MSCRIIRVAVVSPGPRTQGGITEVVRQVLPVLEESEGIRTHWIATHRSGTALDKVSAMFGGIFRALFIVPRVDIVHIHSSYWVSCLRKSAVLWLAWLWRKPVIWHLHAGSAEFDELFGRRDLLGWYARAVVRRARVIVVLTRGWKERVSGIFAGKRIHVLPNPAPKVSVRGEADAAQPSILYLGRLFPRKGHDDLLRAFALVHKAHPAARLVYAGSGEVEQTRALAAELGVSESVDFLGWVSGAAKERLLQEAMVFALPSHQECSPISILEAMAAGLPVVATPVGGIPELIVHGENGLLVGVGERASLADALCRLLEDRTLRARLAQSGQASVAHLSVDKVASEWRGLYTDLVETTASCRTRTRLARNQADKAP